MSSPAAMPAVLAAPTPAVTLAMAMLLTLPLTLGLATLVCWRYQATLTRLMRLAPGPRPQVRPAGTAATAPAHGRPLPPKGLLRQRERRLWWGLAGLSGLIGLSSAALFLAGLSSPANPRLLLLISASDLANRTIEPDELVGFLEGQTQRRYIADASDLERQLAALPPTADHDRRWRISEFCCYDSTWQQVLEALLSRADAVLMDLRGFTAANRGCLYELERLAAAGHLNGILILCDSHTERAIAARALETASCPVHWLEGREFPPDSLELLLGS